MLYIFSLFLTWFLFGSLLVEARRNFCPAEALYSNPFQSSTLSPLSRQASGPISSFSSSPFFPSHSLSVEVNLLSKFEKAFEDHFSSVKPSGRFTFNPSVRRSSEQGQRGDDSPTDLSNGLFSSPFPLSSSNFPGKDTSTFTRPSQREFEHSTSSPINFPETCRSDPSNLYGTEAPLSNELGTSVPSLPFAPSDSYAFSNTEYNANLKGFDHSSSSRKNSDFPFTTEISSGDMTSQGSSSSSNGFDTPSTSIFSSNSKFDPSSTSKSSSSGSSRSDSSDSFSTKDSSSSITTSSSSSGPSSTSGFDSNSSGSSSSSSSPSSSSSGSSSSSSDPSSSSSLNACSTSITKIRGNVKYEEDHDVDEFSDEFGSLDRAGSLPHKCQTIIAYDTSSIVLKTKSNLATVCPVYALSASKVSLFGFESSFAKLFGCAEGWAYGRSTLIAFDWAEADLYDDTRTIVLDNAQVRLYGRSKGILHDQASAELFDASRAFLFERSVASIFIEPLMKINVAAFNDSMIDIRGCRGLDNFYTKGQRHSSLSSSLSSHQFSHGLLSRRRLTHYPVNVYLYDKATLRLPIRCQQYVTVVRRGPNSFISIDSTLDSTLEDSETPTGALIGEKGDTLEGSLEIAEKADIGNLGFIFPTSQDASVQNIRRDDGANEIINLNAFPPGSLNKTASAAYANTLSWIGTVILLPIFVLGAAIVL
ncbi:hypothetical protein MDAP_002031 [Mitosporidium daphniae]